jgi:hypothetical protein
MAVMSQDGYGHVKLNPYTDPQRGLACKWSLRVFLITLVSYCLRAALSTHKLPDNFD